MTDDAKKQWERLNTDTDKSFEAFCIYRDMGAQRSLRDVAQKLNKSLTVFARWSSTHNWVDRANAYDDYQRDLKRQRIEQKRVDIEADALADYDAIRKAIDKRIRTLESVDYVMSPSDLHDLISLMEHANAYARLNSGLPDKISENNNRQSGKIQVEHKVPPLPDNILNKLILDDSE